MPRAGGPTPFRPRFLIGVVARLEPPRLPARRPERLRQLGRLPDVPRQPGAPGPLGGPAPGRLGIAPAGRVHAGHVDELWPRPVAVGQRRVGLPPHEPAPARDDGPGGDGAGPAASSVTRWSPSRGRRSRRVDRGDGRGAGLRRAPASSGARRLGERPRDGARRAAPRPRGPRLRARLGAGGAAGRIPARWLAGSLALFAASLLARATGLVLPLVLVVLDVYPLRRLGGGPGRWLGGPPGPVWIEKIGFVVLALLTVPMAYLARGEEVGDFWHFGYEPAIALAWGVYSLGFYVLKTVVPGTLGPVYPMPDAQDPMVSGRPARLARDRGRHRRLMVLRRRWPGAITAWIVYGDSDRAALGDPALRPAAGCGRSLHVRRVHRVGHRGRAAPRPWAGAGSASGRPEAAPGRARSRWRSLGILVGWSVLAGSRRRSGGTASRSGAGPRGSTGTRPSCRTTSGGPGLRRGSSSAPRFTRAARPQAWPNNPAVLQTLGRIVAAQRRYEESAEILHRAVEIAPRWPEGRTDLGSVLYESGRTGRGGRAAPARDPARPRRGARPRLPRSRAHGEGRLQEAEVHLRRAAELDGAVAAGRAPGRERRPARARLPSAEPVRREGSVRIGVAPGRRDARPPGGHPWPARREEPLGVRAERYRHGEDFPRGSRGSSGPWWRCGRWSPSCRRLERLRELGRPQDVPGESLPPRAVAAEFRYAWSSHLLGEFMPVTWMSYTLDRLLWGLHAPGYHLTSLILHVLAALAVFVLARHLLRHALGPDVPGRAAIDVGAAAAALTFAAPPAPGGGRGVGERSGDRARRAAPQSWRSSCT